MRNFICISGKAQNGKDTSALMMKEQLAAAGHTALIIHQADLLKFICQKFYDWDGKKDERGRTLLQYVGTQVVRQKDPDFWVRFIEQVTDLFDGSWDYIIIPDTRFPNEIEKLRTPTSKVVHVRVVRDGFVSPLTQEQQRHESEIALDNYPCDYILHNDGTKEDLSNNIALLTSDILSRGVQNNAAYQSKSQERRIKLCKGENILG